MLNSGSTGNGNLEGEPNDTLCFLKSLQELKELRFQIHSAADYCEKSFLNTKEKTIVLDNTKEYLCRAVVTVVDHLGSISANLNRRIEKSDTVSETQLRVNCLKQKLDSYDQFNQNFTLTKLRWSLDLPRYCPRYISPPSNSSCKESSSQSRDPNQPTDDASKVSKHEFETEVDVPLFMHTSSNKISLHKSPKSPLNIDAKSMAGDNYLIPVRDGFSVTPKLTRNLFFHFQDNRKASGIRRILQWKSVNDNEIISLLRKRSKREPSRLLKLKF